jgi:hypothetical protein
MDVAPEQVHPFPDAATGPAPNPALLTSADRPAGSTSDTVTALWVGPSPEFVTVSRRVPEYTVVLSGCPLRNVSRL